MNTFNNLKAEVSSKTQEMLREARKYCPVVRSRGRWLGYNTTQGHCCDDKDEWDGTKRALLQYVEANKENALEIYIELGADGADSVHEMNDGRYDPWVGDACVVVWESFKGWRF